MTEMITKAALSRRNLLRGAGIMGLLATTPACASQAMAKKPSFPLLTAEMEKYIAEKRAAGMVAAIGFGQADPQYISKGVQTIGSDVPVDRNSLWRIYSMTKPITGMAAMILIDEGKMTLDTPLADVLPKFANMKVQVTPDGSITDLKAAKTQITMRNLLTHTAGLGYSIIQSGPIKDAYLDAGLIPGQVSRTKMPGLDRGEPVGSLELFADGLAEQPLVYEPGTQWSYSVGLDLMGRVIEVVSGMSFDAFLKERIFTPLDMTSTFFQVPESETHRLTTNYTEFGGTLIPIDPGDSSIFSDKPAFPFGGAGLVSSARDYDRFLMMLLGKGALDGNRIMSEKAATTGMSNILPEGANVSGTWVDGQGFGAGGRVGLGGANGPKGTYGWGGAAGTAAFVDNLRGFRASGYVQYMGKESIPFQNDFPKLVYRDLMG